MTSSSQHHSYAIAIGIALILFFSPLAWWPGDPYGLVKNVVVEWGAFLLAAAWICSSLARGTISWRRSAVTLPLAFFLVWACVSFFFSPFRAFGEARLRELFSCFLLYLVALNCCCGARERRIIFLGAVAGMAAVSLVGLAQYIQLVPTTWDQSPWGAGLGRRVYGLMLNPNILAGHIIAVFPLGLALFLFSWRDRARRVAGAALVLSFICLLFTVSWGGYAGLFACMLLLLGRIAAAGRRRMIISGRGPRLLCTALLLVTACFFFVRGRGTVADTGGMRARFVLWRASAQLVRERPLTGHGPGVLPAVIGEPLTRIIMDDYRKNPAQKPWFDSYKARFMDNDYYGSAIEFGIMGLLLLAWFFAALFRTVSVNLRGETDRTRFCALLGLEACAVALLIQSIVSYPLRVPPTAAVFFVMTGLALPGAGDRVRTLDLRGKDAAWRIIGAGLAVVLAFTLCVRSARTLQGETLLVKAFNYIRVGLWGPVIRTCEAAARCPVTDAEFYKFWGDALRQAGRPRQAAAVLERMLTLDPSRPDIHDILGSIYESGGKHEKALNHYRAAVRLERHDSPHYRLHLAELLHREGRETESRQLLHEGTFLYPWSRELAQALRQIQEE